MAGKNQNQPQEQEQSVEGIKTNDGKNTDEGIKELLNLLKRQEYNFNKRMDELSVKIDKVNDVALGRLKILEDRCENFEQSLQFVNKQYEDQKKITENLIKKQTKLEDLNNQLSNTIGDLKKELAKQNKAVNDLEQYGRRDCIEVSGVPPSESENPEQIVTKIIKEIGVDVTEKDFVACHRVVKAKGDPIIIAKFLNRKIKERVMSQRRNLKGKTVGTLGFHAADHQKSNKIFINESLTQQNKNLFRLVRLKAAQQNWEYFWTRNGYVYAKKNDHSDVTKISDIEEIDSKIV